jgi:ankyrin repeat protein
MLNIEQAEETREECFVLDARFGELDDIKEALNEDPSLLNVDDKPDRQNTALMMASCNGHAEVVKYLCEQPGIEVDHLNVSGSSALHWASQQGHKEVSLILLRN